MSNGTRDTDGGNAQGEEDEKTDDLIVWSGNHSKIRMQ